MNKCFIGDCRDILPTLPAESVDSIVCDPPYGLSFMGKDWDHGVPGVEFWRAALRVAKPGAHLLAFGSTRTHHRLMVAIEDAGWELRDTVMWVYGSGFPKSLDVSKAIDKAAGAEREVVGVYKPPGMDKPWNLRNAKDERTVPLSASSRNNLDVTAAATDAAKQWQGWGTALKPAWEPIILARKPFIATVSENVQKFGTGGLNIDGCRVGYENDASNPATNPLYRKQNGYANGNAPDDGSSSYALKDGTGERNPNSIGRWPANLIHDGSEEVLECFPESVSGALTAEQQKNGGFKGAKNCYGTAKAGGSNEYESNSGSAARFFYCAKANRKDRDAGCESLTDQEGGMRSETSGQHITRRDGGDPKLCKNNHPTVKPTDLMRYLCRLITPPNGMVLDPFMGSGSTGKAAVLEGFNFIGIDKEQEYVAIAQMRISHTEKQQHERTAQQGMQI